MAKGRGSSRGRSRGAKASGKKGGASKSGGKHRSAITGRYVSPKYGKSHPKTTVKESK